MSTLRLNTLSIVAIAAPPHFEGFEDPSWVANQINNWQNYNGGKIQRVPSGTAGITSSSGSAHAVLYDLVNQNNVFGVPTLGAQNVYTRFGGYSNEFGGGFVASIDIYLDPRLCPKTLK